MDDIIKRQEEEFEQKFVDNQSFELGWDDVHAFLNKCRAEVLEYAAEELRKNRTLVERTDRWVIDDLIARFQAAEGLIEQKQ